jgi:hypothetical protein
MSRRLKDNELVKELGREANTPHINNAYRKGVVVSALILVRFLMAALMSHKPAPLPRSGTLAFYLFRNERTAIEEHVVKTGAAWQSVVIDVNTASGVDFSGVAVASVFLLPGFLLRLTRAHGLKALQRFAHPFIAYLTFHVLERELRACERSTVVVTTNMIHPMSIAIHCAAAAVGLRTVFLEHAMTPRSIARDLGYDELLVRSQHTHDMLVDVGIPKHRIRVLPYWDVLPQAVPIEPARVARVGFAVNDLDDIDCVIDVVKRLMSMNKRCEVRVHDSDRRLDTFRKLAARLGYEVSSAAASSIFDFVRRQDLIVVGNSNVLLDCLRAGVPAVYFWSGDPLRGVKYAHELSDHRPTSLNNDELNT